MKLLDQYILRRFAIPLAYCLATFCMVFIIVDLFDHLSDFIEAHTPLHEAVRYYAGLLPASLVYIVPVSLLLAILYSLWQFTRRNELTAMRASGISHLRIMIPILTVAVLASLTVWSVHEFLVPRCVYESAQFIQRVRRGAEADDRYVADLSHKDEAFDRIWTIGRFDRQTAAMKQVKVIQEGPDGAEIEIIYADEAEWTGDYWLFSGVTIQKYDTARQVKGITKYALFPARFYRETPQDFLDEVMINHFDRTKDPAIFSARDLWRILANRRHLADRDLRRYLVELHFRFSMPWTCLIVSIFAVPCGIQTGRRGALYGIIFALLTFFGFYVLLSFSMWLGKNGTLPPVASAWLPNLAVLALGLILLRRLR